MELTTTDGKTIYLIDICTCCEQDSGGNHEWWCPNNTFFRCTDNVWRMCGKLFKHRNTKKDQRPI